jgi:malonyl-CoA O-methyltransferase
MVPVTAIDARKMRENFSGHAGDYDRYAVVQTRVIAELRASLERVGPIEGPALDIGTGTGALAEALSESLQGRTMTVMDIAHGMTRQARLRLGDVGACDGDAAALPFCGEAFQMVASSSVYQWVAQLSAAFTEVRRVLQPGGFFAVALFGEQTLCELRNSHRKAVAACLGGDFSHVQSFPCREEVLAAMRDADLDCHEFRVYPEIDYHQDVPELLRHLKRIGAGNAARNRPRGLSSRRVMQKMMSLYEEHYRQEKGLPATYEVILALARKKPG